MANRTGKKSKKPLQTTLGKATDNSERDVDLSHLQKPINTSIFGLKQVLSLFQTATKEVQNYITYECDILYECRTCKTIFRSLANFILHKRDYCRERFNHLDQLSNNEELQENISENTQLEIGQDVCNLEFNPLSSKEKAVTNTKKTLTPVIERLKEKQEINQLAQEVLNQDLSSMKVVSEEDSKGLDCRNKNDNILLEEIATNNAAVFQTVLRNLPKRNIKKPEFMRSEVMEIHGILDSDEAVLGPDGKICTFETNKINKNSIMPKNDLFCTECNLKFSTKKTLTYHIKYKHNNTRLVYVCPDCKDTFANAWCVYRHLFKIHRRTSAQIKRMREQIHNSCVRKDQEPVKKKDKKNTENMDKTDEENQWLSNIEGDNDFQMCGGCGKRFERKAALHSHAQMCTKRIAVCNTIKENNAKKKEEEVGKDPKNKITKLEKVEVLKGSSKRKPYLLRTYKSNGERSPNRDKAVLPTERNNDICDVNAINCEIVESNCDNGKNISEQLTEEVRNSLSSPDFSSPSKNPDFVSSPSIEKIDTEKMLHIIGITNFENVEGQSDCISKDPDHEDGNSKLEQEILKESSRSHTASDFDLFCQSVTGRLLTENNGEVEECNQKASKTIPLILRRKSLSKFEKKNSILEQNNEVSHGNTSDESKTKADEISEVDKDNVAKMNEANELSTSPSSSNFKITVKSLEDLIGVSPEDHVKSSESKDTDTMDDEIQTTNNKLDHLNSIDLTNEGSDDTAKSNVPQEELSHKYQKCLKRKRTASLDFRECNRLLKGSKRKLFSGKQEISFIGRASPFMDQNKLLCKPCQTTYPTLSKLLWHMSAHFSWFRFQCSKCSFISFSKLDCANHARKIHLVKKASIQSVVLPIPNWKTVLMSHSFCMLTDENDLSGKHTDEVISGISEECETIEDINEKTSDDDDLVHDESECANRLFVESRNLDGEPENDPLESDASTNYASSIKQETIDVVEDTQESFQLEVPQEIYSIDVSEIIDGACYEERYRYGTEIKTEKFDEDDYEDININNYISEHQENEIVVEEIKIKTEIRSDEEIDEKLVKQTNDEATNNFEDQECLKKHSDQPVRKRPTRNRTRSIKTIQKDFFYDLNEVIKLNDNSLSKSNSQKHKKSVNNVSQKGSKDSTSCSSNNANQHLRVYSKKK